MGNAAKWDPLWGKRARAVREAKDMRRENLAAAADVSFTTVWRLESGKPVDLVSLIAIADVLGFSIDELVGRSFAQVSAPTSIDAARVARISRTRTYRVPAASGF